MKKLYALLASVLVAGTAVAAPAQREVRQLNLVPTKTVNLSQEQLQKAPVLDMSENLGPLRSMTSGQGETYSMLVRLLGQTADVVGLYNDKNENGVRDEDEYLTFEEYPYYLVCVAQQQGDPNSNGTLFSDYMNWPCKAYLNDNCWVQKTNEEGKPYSEIDWDKAAQIYNGKEAAQMPASIDELIEAEYVQIPVLAGFYYTVCVIQNDLLGVTETYKGQSYSMKPCTVGTEGIMADGSWISIKSFDPDLREMDFEANYIIGTGDNNGSIIGTGQTVNFVLNGTPAIFGFVPMVFEEMNLHLFDCGVVDGNSDWVINYDNLDFTPVHRYFAVWCDPGYLFMGKRSGSDQMEFAWTEDLEPVEGSMPILPLGRASADAVFNVFNATFYAPENAKWEGLWTMPEPKYTTKTQGNRLVIDSWESVPTAYELIPVMSAAPAEQDGFYAIVEGYGCDPYAGEVVVGCGDKTMGFNYVITQEFWGENTISASYMGSYILHDDPSNYHNYTEVASAIGTADANAFDVSVAPVFESNAPVVGVQYFNLQGQRMSAAPEHGIFIQRAIKADGSVKATKIVK